MFVWALCGNLVFSFHPFLSLSATFHSTTALCLQYISWGVWRGLKGRKLKIRVERSTQTGLRCKRLICENTHKKETYPLCTFFLNLYSCFFTDFLPFTFSCLFITQKFGLFPTMSGILFSSSHISFPHHPSYLSTVLTSPPLTSLTVHRLLLLYVQWSSSQSAHSLHTFPLFSLFLYLCCIILSIHSALSLSFCPSVSASLALSIPFHSLPSHFKKLSPCSLSKALFHPWG